MSYAKKGLDGSDVYVFAFSDDEEDPVLIIPAGSVPPPIEVSGYRCNECSLMPPSDPTETGWEREHFDCRTPVEMIAHLFEHIRIDETVPRATVERLARESELTLEMGRLKVSPGARAALTHEQIAALFERHASFDWAELDAHDVAANVLAIARGERVLSGYTVGSVKLFVITEADRSRTTVLLRSEY